MPFGVCNFFSEHFFCSFSCSFLKECVSLRHETKSGAQFRAPEVFETGVLNFCKKMIVVQNRLLPFRGFSAINLCGVLFVRRGVRLDAMQLNHERIHTRQLCELLVVGFYVWYVVEWLVRTVWLRDAMKAYRMIGFEREAYDHQHDLLYLHRRRHFAWLR